jgi:hypothetical protein
MSQSLAKVGTALALFLVAIGIAFKGCRSSSPAIESDLYASLGRVLAEETAARLAGDASVVLLVPDASFNMPPVKAMVAGFKRDLPRSVDIVAKERVFLERMGPLDGLLTPDRYTALAERYPDAGALVSFVGLGEFDDADLDRLKARPLPVHLISVNASVPPEYFDAGLVRLAVAPRIASPAGSGRALVRKPVASVTRSFEVITLP